MRRWLSRLNSLVRRNIRRKYRVGSFTIILPAGHRLDVYQERFKNYDQPLPRIAKEYLRKYPAMASVDIGANIGDTLAALRSVGDFPVICIEGVPSFVKELRFNSLSIGGTNHIVECFVGPRAGNVRSNAVLAASGTARSKGGIGIATRFSQTFERGDIPVRPIEEVVSATHTPSQVRLVKVDTDGSDFDIIAGSRTFFQESEAAVYFEFDPLMTVNSKSSWLDAVSLLIETGRDRFVVYDNFGNLLISIIHAPLERFAELADFLYSTRINGGGIHYFDILAVHRVDTDLFDAILSNERSQLAAARVAGNAPFQAPT